MNMLTILVIVYFNEEVFILKVVFYPPLQFSPQSRLLCTGRPGFNSLELLLNPLWRFDLV